MYSSTLSLTSALDGGGWSTSRPGRLTPGKKPGIHCIRGWVGPRAGLDGCRLSRPPPEFDSRTVQPVANLYTYYAVRVQQMCIGLHVKHPLFLSDFMKLVFLDRFSKHTE